MVCMDEPNTTTTSSGGTATVTVEPPTGGITVTVDFNVSGHKSSEGDGRTAADIERDMREREEPR
jgi:hypothetical protein